MKQRTLDSTQTLADEICLYLFRWEDVYVKMNFPDPAKFVRAINRMRGNDYQVIVKKNGNYYGYVSKDSKLPVDTYDYDMYIFKPKHRAEVIARLIKLGVYAN